MNLRGHVGGPWPGEIRVPRRVAPPDAPACPVSSYSVRRSGGVSPVVPESISRPATHLDPTVRIPAGMELPKPTAVRAAKTVAYLLGGLSGTAVVALTVLYVGVSIQPVVYDAFYRHVGPSEATETAILSHFLLAGFTAVSVALLAGDYVSDRLRHRRAVASAITVLGGLLVVFLVVALLELAAFLTALGILAVGVVAVPLLLRYRYSVRSGGVTAFVGGIPVLVVLLLFAGFGLGWGWGYIMTAQAVPASTVDGTAAADFDDVPQIRDDLFTSDCSTGTDGRRVCRMYLRGYEHEARVARFMARHGVRCPYQNLESGEPDSFIATHNGTYYRVSCSPHGD